MTARIQPFSSILTVTGFRDIFYNGKRDFKVGPPKTDMLVNMVKVYDWYHRASEIHFQFGLDGIPKGKIIEAAEFSWSVEHVVGATTEAILDPYGAVGNAWTTRVGYSDDGGIFIPMAMKEHEEAVYTFKWITTGGNPVTTQGIGHGTARYALPNFRMIGDGLYSKIALDDLATVADQSGLDSYAIVLTGMLTFACKGKLNLETLFDDWQWIFSNSALE